jgi:heterotetrameric sarcosine oxidase alpha subunit
VSASRRGGRLGAATLRFSFDGREIEARAGDTAASALLASGVRLMGRSVKYRRPRGVFTAGFEEPNALFTVGTAPAVIPNVPAPQLAVREGLQVRSQNRWPTLRHDVSALLQAGGGFFGAGFYYKTFMWPSWKAYESLIRRLAGLGEAPGASDLPPVDVEHIEPDVLVAGAGAAGLSAALAAARAGARVLICEREAACGGELEFEAATIGGVAAQEWVASALRELAERNVRVLTETAVIGGSGGLVIAQRQQGGLAGSDSYFRIRPRSFVIAAGAVERPIAFVNNDLPGVMLLGAAERYLARYGAHAGKSVVLFGNHDRLYAAAARLRAGGIAVRAIVDTREDAAARFSAREREALRNAGVECLSGHAVLAARGRLEVSGVRIAPLSSPRSTRSISCDAVLVSGGWSPAIHPGLHEGGTKAFMPDVAAFVAADQPEWRIACGAGAGALELGAVMSSGHSAGERAAQHAAAQGRAGLAPVAKGDGAPYLVQFWRSPGSLADEKKQFVDLQNDVTVSDLRQALDEGFRDIEHVKRYTTLGVGTEQGRTGGVLGAAIIAELSGGTLAGVGTSRTRPPYQPITLNSLVGLRAGLALRPVRRTPMHDWHASHGGVLEAAGWWMRPRYYTTNGNSLFEASKAEAARVRAHGGICDGSTLGKIEVCGPDAAAFLDRVYLSKASTIKVGRSKYMVNLREDGMVLDDGIVLRVAEDRFLATVSSGHAGHMLSHFEFWRDAIAGKRALSITDVTEAWAVIVVAGPRSRDTLRDILGAEWHAALAGLTHMGFADGRWQGRALRVLRASFSGELAFELHCRPSIALPLWTALDAAGMAPYGLEALDILRVEKGYLVTSEINGQTTPQDLGMDSIVKLGNACVGRDLLNRPAFGEAQRPRLVGLQATDRSATFLAGAQVTVADAPTKSVGHVTSTVFSPTLDRWIGLALVGRHLAAEGTQLLARDPLRGLETPVKVVSPVHVDAAGERMRA